MVSFNVVLFLFAGFYLLILLLYCVLLIWESQLVGKFYEHYLWNDGDEVNIIILHLTKYMRVVGVDNIKLMIFTNSLCTLLFVYSFQYRPHIHTHSICDVRRCKWTGTCIARCIFSIVLLFPILVSRKAPAKQCIC